MFQFFYHYPIISLTLGNKQVVKKQHYLKEYWILISKCQFNSPQLLWNFAKGCEEEYWKTNSSMAETTVNNHCLQEE